MKDLIRPLIDEERFDPFNAVIAVPVAFALLSAMFYIKYTSLSVEAKYVVILVLDVLMYLTVYNLTAFKWKYAILFLAFNVLLSIKNLLMGVGE